MQRQLTTASEVLPGAALMQQLCSTSLAPPGYQERHRFVQGGHDGEQTHPNACHSSGSVGMACHSQEVDDNLIIAHVLHIHGWYTNNLPCSAVMTTGACVHLSQRRMKLLNSRGLADMLTHSANKKHKKYTPPVLCGRLGSGGRPCHCAVMAAKLCSSWLPKAVPMLSG